MYVCLCNSVTDHDIRAAARAGCRSMPELTMRTGCGATCGSCIEMATELLHQARDELRADAEADADLRLDISHAA